MNKITSLGLIIIGISMSVIILTFLITLLKKMLNPKKVLKPINSILNDSQIPYLKEIERMHLDNESKMMYVGDKEIYERTTGLSANNESNIEKILNIENWEESDPKSDIYRIGEYLTELMLDLNRRFVIEKLKFDVKNEKDVLREFSLNIKENEKLIYKISNYVHLFEEKERIANITYSGFSTNFRSGNLHYKIGNLKPLVNREAYWNSFDKCKLFMLNSKMIFVGTEKKKNKVIKYDDILTGELFSNGVLLSLANSKKILIDFPEFKNSIVKRDDRNIFTRVLERILNDTIDQDLI